MKRNIPLLLSACGGTARKPTQAPAASPTPELTPTRAAVPTSALSPTAAERTGTRASPDSPTATVRADPSVRPTETAPLVVAQGNGLDHDPVFTIHNAGRYSGEAGQASWLGWGATGLAVAPDASFWIADTPANPDRLLHYSPQGNLLLALPLRFGDRSYWAGDLAVDASGVWVLDYISQPSLVLQLSPDGSLQGSYAIPAELTTFEQNGTTIPGLWRIPFAEGGRVTLDGPAGIVELTVTDGSASFKKVTSYTLGGSTYTDVQTGLTAGGVQVDMQSLQPDHFLNRAWLLGAASDGSFYVRVDEGNNDQGMGEPTDQFVRRYSGNGQLLGIALLPLPQLDQADDVALEPDGNVYALRSRDDHSVDVLRLRFAVGVTPLLSPFTAPLKTSFAALLPSGDPPATDLAAARQAMLSFFSALADKRYADAAPLYGGSYEAAMAQDASISPDRPAQAWEMICTSEFCLPVSDIVDSRALSPDEYEFLVGFAGLNGVRFDYSICCGYFGPPPVTSFFVYSVKVERVDGQWRVMGGPVPTP